MAKRSSDLFSAAPPDTPQRVTIYSPSGVVADGRALTRAAKRLKTLGFDVRLDASARARHQRFAGDDATRLAALHRVAEDDSDIALASRGGYGLTRLLDQIDFARIAASIDAGKRWVGYSDQTAFQLAVLAHTKRCTWAGPMAIDDFSRPDEDGGTDDVTEACFSEAMSGQLEAIGFKTGQGFNGLNASGVIWGGNLTMLVSLLGTTHWPMVDGGILFLEDVNEAPYRVERCLVQLHQAGVLRRQQAIVLGAFTAFKPSPLDRGYGFNQVFKVARKLTSSPVLTGLPFGHVQTKVTLPIGRKAALSVSGRDVLIAWD